ncbi:MAG: flagellar export protein FliJ [Acidobacteriota bacterium]
MKRFAFSLQHLLKYRTHLEEMAEAELHRLLKKKVDLVAAMKELNRRVEQLGRERQRKKEMSAHEVGWFATYIAHLGRRLRAHSRELQALEGQVMKQRQRLIAAMRQRKVLDRLKTRQAEKHVREADRLVQREADDLFLQRWPRKGSGDAG